MSGGREACPEEETFDTNFEMFKHGFSQLSILLDCFFYPFDLCLDNEFFNVQ